MNPAILTITLYIVVGLLVASIEYERKYKHEYNIQKNTVGVEDGALGIVLLVFTFGWPIVLIKNFVKFIIKKSNQK